MCLIACGAFMQFASSNGLEDTEVAPDVSREHPIAASALYFYHYSRNASIRVCSECPLMGGCCAGRVAAGACIELSEEVLKEAQIGAIYALYAAYYTQQSKPIVRIYMSPAHVTALRKLLPVRIAAAVTSE